MSRRRLFLADASDAQILQATTYNSHFPEEAKGGEAWNGITVAHDGTVYYVLSSPEYNVPAQMYSFNPKTKAITHISSLNDAVGQGDQKAVAQGKSHVSFVEDNGKLYFSTHLGYYAHVEGVETTAPAPNGYAPYPGGHFVSYDLKTGKFENLAIAPGGEGIITFAMDTQRGRLYGITWPTGHFLSYDLKTKDLEGPSEHSFTAERPAFSAAPTAPSAAASSSIREMVRLTSQLAKERSTSTATTARPSQRSTG